MTVGETDTLADHVVKSDFMKSLATHLRDMRITERQRRNKDVFCRRGKIMDMDSDFDSLEESDDDEYVLRQPKAKKRRGEDLRIVH
jgi:hypothetical protein